MPSHPPVRVLHLITQLELGGAQQTTLELIRRIDPARYRVVLATAPGGPLEAEARSIPQLTVVTLPALERSLHLWRDARCLRQLIRLMREQRFDIVHTHSSKAGILGRWAARRAGVPVICHTVHGFAFHPFQPTWRRRTYQAIERSTARVTTRLIHVSRHDARTALAAGIGRPEQYRYIPYGIDLERFHPAPQKPPTSGQLLPQRVEAGWGGMGISEERFPEATDVHLWGGVHRNGLSPESARLQLGLRADAPTIGTVACFKPQKAPDDFLDLCERLRQRLPTLQCVMVGDGALRPAIEQEIRARGLESTVHLLGWRRDIPSILTALDAFVLTSRWEGLPVAVLEAQAMGLPVVVTDTGGVRDCVEDGVNGFIVPIGDVGALADRVTMCVREPHRARLMAERAHVQVARRFSVERMVKDVEEMYTEAMQAVGHRGV